MKRPPMQGAGRPSGYTPDLPEKISRYFVQAAQALDRALTEGRRDNIAFPTLGEALRQHGVAVRSVQRWAGKHADLLAALFFARQVQRDFTELGRVLGLKFEIVGGRDDKT